MEMNQYETIKEIEGEIEQDSVFNPNDLQAWRKRLWSFWYQKKKITETKKLRDSIIEEYDTEIEQQEEKLKNFELHLKEQLLQSEFKTKTGGFKIDQIAELPAFSLSKERISYLVNDEKEWLQTFGKTIPEETKLDKESLNKHIEQNIDKGTYKIEGHSIIDTSTGEIVSSIDVQKKRTLKFDIEKGV